MGKAKYFMTFIDDFIRKTWIVLLQEKLDAFIKFVEFWAMVERKSGYKVKILRSDNGGEFISNEFKEFCRALGIKWQYTTPYTP